MLHARIFNRALLIAILIVMAMAQISSYAASYELRRQVPPKEVLTNLPGWSDCDGIVIKLAEGIVPPGIDNRRFLMSGGEWDRLNEIVSGDDKVTALRRRLTFDPAKLDAMRAEGSKRVGWPLPDMNLYYEIDLNGNLSADDRLEVINRLNGLDVVEIAYFAPRYSVDAQSDASISASGGGGGGGKIKATPSFEYGQYYLRQAPIGFDAYYAWSFPGGKGDNVRVIDIESNWTETHEDLSRLTETFLLAGEEDNSSDHGTAVFGIIGADSNSFGMTGMAYNADLKAVSMATMSIADAVLVASGNAATGDIFLIECAIYDPTFGIYPEGGQIPVEYAQENFDAILLVSSLGQIIVDAPGNCSYNLNDTALFDSLFYPEYRFSGSIYAGSTMIDHTPDFRTSYGTRLDVHGFGLYDVYTLGFGFLWGTTEDNYYTHAFSGTSAASAEMAAACAVVQSVYRSLNGSSLDHSGMRELLTTFSVPQQEHYKHVGPMPDLAGICNALTGNVRPLAPIPIAPIEDTYFDTYAQPTLDWEDVTGATSYEVMIDNDYSFASPEVSQTGLTVSQWTAPALEFGRYFWRVRAVNESGIGLWSASASILVGVQIQAPTLVGPIDEENLRGRDNFRFEWTQIYGVTDYIVEIDESEDFSSPLRFAYAPPCTEGTCAYVAVSLWYEGIHYWRVKAVGDNWPWSNIQTCNYNISWLDKPDVEAPDSLENTVKLKDNYPNPFNPVTEISFSLPEATHAKLEIFNVLGQKVSTLVDGTLGAGDHRVTWDGTNAASGVYLYRLTAGDQSMTKKMLLLK